MSEKNQKGRFNMIFRILRLQFYILSAMTSTFLKFPAQICTACC